MGYHDELTGEDLHEPKPHGVSHTNGTDDIQDATASSKGLMTATQAGKLDGIATGADVTKDAISGAAIIDGLVTGTGTASHFALTDDSASEIIASGPLDSSQAVSSGNTFTLTEFEVGIPDPAA